MLGSLSRIPGWLHRLSRTIATTTPLSHLATTRAHCAHCERETPWAVHAMSGFYRCRRCGRDPLADPSRAE